jgi:hypothetical protein
MIDGNTLSRRTDNSVQFVTIKWETEYYNITFFTGLDLNGIYSPENGGYAESTNGIWIRVCGISQSFEVKHLF